MARFYPTGGGGGADTSVVTAGAGDVLSGKVIVDANGNPLTGVMTNNGAVAPSALGAGGSYTIPAGYHNGSGKVTVQSLATMTASGDATAAQILSGKKAYVDGNLITGTIASKAAATYYATKSDQTISAGQYLGGAQTIKAVTLTNISAANIKAGVTVRVNNGNADITAVAGTFTSDATATAAQILSGKIAYVNGSKLTGTLAVTSAISFSATALSATSVRISWTNPSKGPWEGVFIQMSTSGNPGVSGGSQVYKGRGNNGTTGGASNYVDITGLTPGTTYYFTCTSYATGLGNGSSYNVSATTKGKILYWEGSAPYTISNGDTGNMNLYLNSTNIQFTRKYEAGSLSLNIATGNMDLSAYTKFCVSCSITSAIYNKVMFNARYVKTAGTTTLSTVGTVVEGTKSTTLFQTDISSITYTYGKMGIRMYSMDSEGGQSGISGYIYRIWLE